MSVADSSHNRGQLGRLPTGTRPVYWLCAAVVLAFLLAGAIALAATFTPDITAQLGYSDNIRFQSNARSDAFLRLEPGFKLEAGRPSRRFMAKGRLRYTEYLEHSELTQFEGGDLDLAYHHEFSQRWDLLLRNTLTSSYDEPILSDRDQRVVQLRGDQGRRDSNVTYIRSEYRWGPEDYFYGGYRYDITRNTSDSAEDSQHHQVEAGFGSRLGPDWRTELSGYSRYNDYEKSADTQRSEITATLYRLMGPTRSAYLRAVFMDLQGEGGGAQERDNRSYRTYTFSLGYDHEVSKIFKWGVSLGFSSVEGESQANAAAGNDYPTVSAYLSWLGEVWQLTFFADSSLGEYDLYGDNSGLSFTRRVGVNYLHHLGRHWTLETQAIWITDSYKQDPFLTGTDPQYRGDVTSYLLHARLTWQVARHAYLGLDYRYQERDDEDDQYDRRENRIFSFLTYEWPYRW